MKAKPTKEKSTKPTLKVRDLKPKTNPAGGMTNIEDDMRVKGTWNGK